MWRTDSRGTNAEGGRLVSRQRDTGDLAQGAGRGGKWLELRHVLQVDVIGPVDGLYGR